MRECQEQPGDVRREQHAPHERTAAVASMVYAAEVDALVAWRPDSSSTAPSPPTRQPPSIKLSLTEPPRHSVRDRTPLPQSSPLPTPPFSPAAKRRSRTHNTHWGKNRKGPCTASSVDPTFVQAVTRRLGRQESVMTDWPSSAVSARGQTRSLQAIAASHTVNCARVC